MLKYYLIALRQRKFPFDRIFARKQLHKNLARSFKRGSFNSANIHREFLR